MSAARCRRSCLLALFAATVAIALVMAPAAGCSDPTTTSSASTTASSILETTTSSAAAATTSSSAAILTTTTTAEVCSASGLGLGLFPQLGLPYAVAQTRQTIFEAAAGCDFDALEAFAEAGGGISFSFGAPGGVPAPYWRAAEQSGDPVMATLVKILNMPYGQVEGNYVWPFAHALDFSGLTDEQRRLLKQYFSDEDIESWVDFGGYTGYRVGISQEGKWLYFVAGD